MKRLRYMLEYLFLFVANGIMLWFFRGYLNLLIAVAMILLFFYAFFSVHLVKKYVSLEMKAPAEEIPKNTEFFIRLRLKNRCWLPLVTAKIFLRTGNSFAGDLAENVLALPLRPGNTVEIQYPLTSAYVGNVEVCSEKIVLYDLLGFHSVTVKVQATESVYILPTGGSEEKFVLNDYETGMDEVEESRLTGSDFSDVSQIREYIPGDAMKNIHWKLSAKKDILMVKERLHMSSRKLLLVLSLDKEEAEKTDGAVERLFSFGTFCLSNRVPVTLFWWSDRYHEIRQETAESGEEWRHLMTRLFHDQAGNGYVEEHFRSGHPGKGYILVKNDEIRAVV